MKENLVISVVQSDLMWENPTAGYVHMAKLLAQVPDGSDLVILPEMFTTGFTMNREVAEKFDDNMPTLMFLKTWAVKLNAVVTGSLTIVDDGKYYNRLFYVMPDGTVGSYNKRHLFRMASEHLSYEGGQSTSLFEWKGWRIMPMICYDLRFPVWSRNAMDANGRHKYDVVYYVANWPAVRSHPWRTLLMARAIENQAYCIGVNRVGTDGNGLNYEGGSLILNSRGEILLDAQKSEGVFTHSLSKEDLCTFREKFPVLNDADAFDLK